MFVLQHVETDRPRCCVSCKAQLDTTAIELRLPTPPVTQITDWCLSCLLALAVAIQEIS